MAGEEEEARARTDVPQATQSTIHHMCICMCSSLPWQLSYHREVQVPYIYFTCGHSHVLAISHPI